MAFHALGLELTRSCRLLTYCAWFRVGEPSIWQQQRVRQLLSELSLHVKVCMKVTEKS